MRRFQTDLQYPLLDSFPHSLFQTRQQDRKALDISAALVCTSTMKDRILGLRDATFRMMQLDEREIIYNDLTEMSQHYSVGWDSGTDTGDDED